MNCEANFCIYNKNYGCILKEIEIDSSGMCISCINISLNSDFLEEEKERQLEQIESRWNEMLPAKDCNL